MTQRSPTFSARQFLGTRALPPVLKALARRRRAGLAGGLMRAAVEPFGPPGGEGAARLLALPKAGFTEDALAVFGDDPRFKLLGLHRGCVKAVYPAFLPPWVDDNNYLSAPAELDSAKTALRDFWARAWWELQRTARADAVVTGNFAYHAEQELATAVEASGVPFIAMHKEALKTPGRAAFFTELYRNRRRPFAGRRILVYNRIERDIQIEAGIVPPERVTACGMPRLRPAPPLAAAGGGSPRSGRGPPPVAVLRLPPQDGAATNHAKAQRAGRQVGAPGSRPRGPVMEASLPRLPPSHCPPGPREPRDRRRHQGQGGPFRVA